GTMRQHRLICRNSDLRNPSYMSFELPSTEPSGTAKEVKEEKPLSQNPALTRRPIVRAYRFKKESSICGVTCSCCYHTILKPTRKRKTSAGSSISASGPSPSGSSTSENSSRDKGMIAHTDTTMSSTSSASLESSCWPTPDEMISAEDDRDNWTVEELQVDGSPSKNSSRLIPEDAYILPFITVERKGEKLQFAAKKPRKTSMCSTSSSMSSAATTGVTVENASTPGERTSEIPNGAQNHPTTTPDYEQMPFLSPVTSCKTSGSSSESTPVCRPSKAKPKRIYIVTRWSPDDTPVKGGTSDCDVSVNQPTEATQPPPKKSRIVESEAVSSTIRITHNVQEVSTKSDLTEKTVAAGPGSVKDSSDSNSTTSTDFLEEPELCEEPARSRSQSPSVADDTVEEEEQFEVTPRITRSRAAAIDSLRSEASEYHAVVSQLLTQRRPETPTTPTGCFQRPVRIRRMRLSSRSRNSSENENGVNKESPAKYAPSKSAPLNRPDSERSPSIDSTLPLPEDVPSVKRNVSKKDPNTFSKKTRVIPAMSRRRRRKIITMKKYRRKQPPLNQVFGSPVRRKIDVDEWFREGDGKYTREAVVMFEKIQEEEQRLRQQRRSEKGGIEWVNLGGQFKIRTWFSGNYPAEYSHLKTIYICDGCFSYFSHEPSQIRHMTKCIYRYAPPGDEIYRDKKKDISVFEVRGTGDPMYCSNLCRLTMLWLENKVIFMDVEPFDFYVLTDFFKGRFRPLGYFSRQRQFFTHNLSCFCVFPCYQRHGYGTFLVDLSYLLSRMSGLPGGPERPFSIQGSQVYNKYWCDKLLHLIYTKTLKLGWENMRLDIGELSKEAGIQEAEVLEALTGLCNCEMSRNNRSLNVKISEDAVMAIGKYIDERKQSRLLAKEEFLERTFKERLKLYSAEANLT
ncbi:hypothetical protein V3C99_010690, partial [Haemonchus contortus]